MNNVVRHCYISFLKGDWETFKNGTNCLCIICKFRRLYQVKDD